MGGWDGLGFRGWVSWVALAIRWVVGGVALCGWGGDAEGGRWCAMLTAARRADSEPLGDRCIFEAGRGQRWRFFAVMRVKTECVRCIWHGSVVWVRRTGWVGGMRVEGVERARCVGQVSSGLCSLTCVGVSRGMGVRVVAVEAVGACVRVVCMLEHIGPCGGCPNSCGLDRCWIALLFLWGKGGNGVSGVMRG